MDLAVERCAMDFKPCRTIGAIMPLIILVAVVSCSAKYVNRVTIFVVQGQIIDQETHRPIKDVKVYFVDTGFDYVRSRKEDFLEIGQSDPKGKINLRLNYPWRQGETLLSSSQAKTFDIVLKKEFYATKRLQFDHSMLKSDRVAFLVDLKEIYLIPRK